MDGRYGAIKNKKSPTTTDNKNALNRKAQTKKKTHKKGQQLQNVKDNKIPVAGKSSTSPDKVYVSHGADTNGKCT